MLLTYINYIFYMWLKNISLLSVQPDKPKIRLEILVSPNPRYFMCKKKKKSEDYISYHSLKCSTRLNLTQKC